MIDDKSLLILLYIVFGIKTQIFFLCVFVILKLSEWKRIFAIRCNSHHLIRLNSDWQLIDSLNVIYWKSFIIWNPELKIINSTVHFLLLLFLLFQIQETHLKFQTDSYLFMGVSPFETWTILCSTSMANHVCRSECVILSIHKKAAAPTTTITNACMKCAGQNA